MAFGRRHLGSLAAVVVVSSCRWASAAQGVTSLEIAPLVTIQPAGYDGAIPLDDRVQLVPSFRYSRAFRGDHVDDVGLGADIFRIGLGVRVRLSGS